MTDEMMTSTAIYIVAQAFVSRAIEDALGEGWGLYPEIDENDWEAVAECARRLTPNHPPTDEFLTAYAHLEARAQLREDVDSH
jgi:hypothetical protein